MCWKRELYWYAYFISSHPNISGFNSFYNLSVFSLSIEKVRLKFCQKSSFASDLTLNRIETQQNI